MSFVSGVILSCKGFALARYHKSSDYDSYNSPNGQAVRGEPKGAF